MAFKLNPIRCASPTLRTVFELADAENLSGRGFAKRAHSHHVTMSKWRQGANCPSIMNVEEMAAAIEHRLVLIPVDRDYILVPKHSNIKVS